MVRPDGTLGLPVQILVALVVVGGFYAAISSDPFSTFFFVCYVLVAGLLVNRRPTNLVSWLLLAIAFGFIGTTGRPSLDFAALKTGTASFGDETWVWLGSWSGAATFVLYAALAATFPTGRLPVGPWRRPLVVALAVGGAIVLVSMVAPRMSASTDGVDEVLVPNPIALIPDFAGFETVMLAGFLVVLGVFALSIANLLTRYRVAAEITRLQIRWLLAAIIFVLIGVSVGLFLGTVFPSLGGLVWIVAIAAYPTVPAAIGIAVLRYRLYEIDRIVNRALVYGAVTAILAGVFAAVTLLTQRLFVALTGQRSDAAIVLTTLAVATMYTPLRKRVELIVDRYFKYDQRLFGAYRDELRRALDVLAPARAAHRLAHEARSETGASGVAVTGSDGSILASAGQWPAEPTIAIPVRADGAPLAAVLLGPRHDGRPHRSQAITALGEVAAMAGVASTAIRTSAEAEPVAQPER